MEGASPAHGAAVGLNVRKTIGLPFRDLDKATRHGPQGRAEDAGVQLPFATWEDAIAAGEEVSTDDGKMFTIHGLSFGDWYMLTQYAGTSVFDENGEHNGDAPPLGPRREGLASTHWRAERWTA